MGSLRVLTGLRFGRLTVGPRAGSQSGSATWQCRCDCGTVIVTRANSLRAGLTRSCGCLNREVARARATVLHIKHGHSRRGAHHPLYGIWAAMHRRCENPRVWNYASYGGRGIRVCEQWRDFAAFLRDMGERPTAQHSIDRLDNDGNYEPSNCRWATRSEQRRNRRRPKAVSS